MFIFCYIRRTSEVSLFPQFQSAVTMFFSIRPNYYLVPVLPSLAFFKSTSSSQSKGNCHRPLTESINCVLPAVFWSLLSHAWISILLPLSFFVALNQKAHVYVGVNKVQWLYLIILFLIHTLPLKKNIMCYLVLHESDGYWPDEMLVVLVGAHFSAYETFHTLHVTLLIYIHPMFNDYQK